MNNIVQELFRCFAITLILRGREKKKKKSNKIVWEGVVNCTGAKGAIQKRVWAEWWLWLDFFYCFHFGLHLNQQTQSVEEIQNKNVSEWIQNRISYASVPYDGACIFKQTGHCLQGMRNFWGWRSQGTWNSGIYNIRQDTVTLVPKDVTHKKKGSYSELHAYTFLYFCDISHSKLLGILSRHAISDHCKK